MTDERMKVAPEVCSYVDSDSSRLNIQVSIPGVKRDQIRLKMRDDSFTLSAPRDDIEYVAALSFCCPVDSRKSNAHYEDGLLKIGVPFKDPMDDAVDVPIH